MTTAMGIIGLDPAVFWSLSLTEWLHVQRGYLFREEMAERHEWERARMVAYFAVKPHVKRGTLQTVGSIIRFPWEVEETEPLKEDEVNDIIRKYGKYYDEKTDQFVN